MRRRKSLGTRAGTATATPKRRPGMPTIRSPARPSRAGEASGDRETEHGFARAAAGRGRSGSDARRFVARASGGGAGEGRDGAEGADRGSWAGDDRRCRRRGPDGCGEPNGVRDPGSFDLPARVGVGTDRRRCARSRRVRARQAGQGPRGRGRSARPRADHRDSEGGRGMGQDPSDIRAELEETRGRVGAEVDALSYKTDVSARVGDYVDEKKQAVKDKFTGARDAVTGTASRAVPDGQRVSRMKDTAERNPIGLAVGAAAVGFVAGLMIPSTRAEDERLGQMSDRLVEAAKETAGDAVERGKQVAQDAAETAKESGRQQSQELASNLQDRAQESGRSPESAPIP